MLGKEAALFLPSGTMANLTAFWPIRRRARSCFWAKARTFIATKSAGFHASQGCCPRLFNDRDGLPAPDDLRALLRPPNIHFPTPTLLCLENSHNLAGGVVLPPERLQQLVAGRGEAGLAVHLDGARLFNAAAALGVDVRAWTQHVDSVMIALSKGLSAPVGSILAGDLTSSSGPESEKAAGRRHASSRCHCGSGHRRSGDDDGAFGRRSRGGGSHRP